MRSSCGRKSSSSCAELKRRPPERMVDGALPGDLCDMPQKCDIRAMDRSTSCLRARELNTYMFHSRKGANRSTVFLCHWNAPRCCLLPAVHRTLPPQGSSVHIDILLTGIMADRAYLRALPAMRVLMSRAFFATRIAYHDAYPEEVMRAVRISTDAASGEHADIRAIPVKADALLHVRRVGFIQAGISAMLTGRDALHEGLEKLVGLRVFHVARIGQRVHNGRAAVNRIHPFGLQLRSGGISAACSVVSRC